MKSSPWSERTQVVTDHGSGPTWVCTWISPIASVKDQSAGGSRTSPHSPPPGTKARGPSPPKSATAPSRASVSTARTERTSQRTAGCFRGFGSSVNGAAGSIGGTSGPRRQNDRRELGVGSDALGAELAPEDAEDRAGGAIGHST